MIKEIRSVKNKYPTLKDTVRAFFSKDTSWRLKIIPIAGFAYVLWPIDAVTDFIPLLGQLDDLGIIILSFQSFNKYVRLSHEKTSTA